MIMRHFLLTYFIKNTDERTKNMFEFVPYKSDEISMTDEQLMKLINSKFKQQPYLRFITGMEKPWEGNTEYKLKFTATNLYYSETAAPRDYNPEAIENRDMRDYSNAAFFSKYEVLHKGFEVNLEKEEKVIGLGAYSYNLKGVLICEASEEEKKKYYCDKYMIYPIVDEPWRVYEGDEICDGIDRQIIGKKGDTLLLRDLIRLIDYNTRENVWEYESLLQDVEKHGITVSNRKSLDSGEELSDTIVLEITRDSEDSFTIRSHHDSYYISRRHFSVGDDDELYECERDGSRSPFNQKIITRLVDDVYGLSYFFNKPNLRVLVTARVLIDEEKYEFENVTIPKDWYYTVQTLEADINRELDALHQQYPNSYFKEKRPDTFVEKK